VTYTGWEDFQDYSADVVSGMGLPGAMIADAFTGGNATQRIVAEGGIGVQLGSLLAMAATSTLVGTAVGNSFRGLLTARTMNYGTGYAHYHAHRTDHWAMTIPGYMLGFENIYQSLGTVCDSNAPGWQRGLAALDVGANVVLGVSMLSGVRSSANAWNMSRVLRQLGPADRFAQLQRWAAASSKTLVELTDGIPYRPLGEQVIQLSRNKLAGSAGNLSGAYAHELAHVAQEFGPLGHVAKPFLKASAWSVSLKVENPVTMLGKFTGFSTYGYVLNPVEVHAFSSGLTNSANIVFLGASRTLNATYNSWYNTELGE
jgi:hypothetical protein